MNQDSLIRRARAQLSEAQPNVEFAFATLTALVPLALARLLARAQSDPKFRQNFIVETSAIQIVAGEVADATDVMNQYGILPGELNEAEILIVYEESPYIQSVQMVEQLDRLNLVGRGDQFFVLCYAHGTKLYFKHPKLSLAGKSVKIRGISHSKDVSVLPDALEGHLALELAALAPRPGTAIPIAQNLAASQI